MRHNANEHANEHGADTTGHGHDHGDGHGHGHGLRGRLRSVLRPHSHDAADSVDPRLEASAEGIRAVKISLVVLLVTAVLQPRRRGGHRLGRRCWPTPSTTSPTR